MKKIIYIISIISVIGIFGCGEDYLEISDPNVLSPASFPKSMNDMDLLLNAIYADQHSFGLFGHNMFGKNLYCFDHTLDNAWIAFQYWNDLSQNDTKPENQFMGQTWRDSWRGVQHANNLISVIPEYKEKYAKDFEMEELDRIEGQARFLRAWFYYYLLGFWGEDITNPSSMGVPIISEVAGTREGMYKERATVGEVWEFMISDLKEAEALLQGVEWTDNADKGRADEWAVKGFLGKIYTFQQNWDNAKSYLKNVIENSGKELVTYDVYKDMFNNKHEFNKESLYEISMSIDKNTWGAWGPSAGSGVAMVIAPCFMNDEGGSTGSGWSNVFPHDKNIQRFGYNLDEPEMIDNPDFDPDEDVSIDNLDKIPNPEDIEEIMQVRENKSVDPRLFVSVLEPYVDSMNADGRLRPITPYKDVPPEYKAWSFRKYINLEGNEYSINVNNGSNFYWLRLPDVYLLYAEALSKTGDDTNALEYINKVKRRAYGYDPDSPSPVDYQSMSDNTMANDPVLGNDPLKYERWAELFGEGNWWFDVRRWKLGSQEADYYERTRGGVINWSDNDYAQPIPLDEMETNPAIEQNPGYN